MRLLGLVGGEDVGGFGEDEVDQGLHQGEHRHLQKHVPQRRRVHHRHRLRSSRRLAGGSAGICLEFGFREGDRLLPSGRRIHSLYGREG